MEYSKKLQNPNWQRKRLEILQRDNFKCILCNSDNKELHVHHRWYQFGKNIWDYPDNCFETLCFECHEYIETNIKDSTSDLQVIIRKTHLNQDDYNCINQLLLHLSDDIYQNINPIQIKDAIDYIIENCVIGQIIKIRSDKFN
jgi:hypothetical protein